MKKIIKTAGIITAGSAVLIGLAKANKKIENAVVGTYKKIENSAVEAYGKVEDAFVDSFLKHDGESVMDAKERLKKAANNN